MHTVAAIDPGKTTGYVVTRLQSDGEISVVDSREIVWEQRFVLIPLLEGLIKARDPLTTLHIVLESFVLYPHESQNQIGSMFPSVRVIGLCEAASYLYGGPTLIFQPAANTSRVKILPQHEHLFHSEHTRDAYKHARYYIEVNRAKLI